MSWREKIFEPQLIINSSSKILWRFVYKCSKLFTIWSIDDGLSDDEFSVLYWKVDESIFYKTFIWNGETDEK